MRLTHYGRMDEMSIEDLLDIGQRLTKLWIGVLRAGHPRGLTEDIERMQARLMRERKRRRL